MRSEVQRRAAVPLLAVVLVLAAGARAAEEPAPKPVTVSTEQQARLGVRTQKLAPADAPAGLLSTARVLDPAPLIQLDSDLAAAVSSLTASRAEAARTRRLYGEDRTASAHAVESADAQAQADEQRVSAAGRRLLLEWGSGVAALPAARRTALLNDLAHVRAELVRVELPADAAVPGTGAIVRLQPGGAAEALPAKTLGMLPVADPRLQTRGLLVELRGAQASLAVGQMLTAQLPAAAAPRGVLLPRSSLLRLDSRVWAYVQTTPTRFVRREVRAFQVLEAGWYVPAGFAPGEAVVTAGAGALMGVETPAGGAD
jgi:hypothetical protein